MTHVRLLLLSIGFGIVGLAAQQAQATPNYCAARDVVTEQLATHFGEVRQAQGLAREDQLIEVYASPDTGSWTITVTYADGTTCLVAAGQAYQYLGLPLAALGRGA